MATLKDLASLKKDLIGTNSLSIHQFNNYLLNKNINITQEEAEEIYFCLLHLSNETLNQSDNIFYFEWYFYLLEAPENFSEKMMLVFLKHYHRENKNVSKYILRYVFSCIANFLNSEINTISLNNDSTLDDFISYILLSLSNNCMLETFLAMVIKDLSIAYLSFTNTNTLHTTICA